MGLTDHYMTSTAVPACVVGGDIGESTLPKDYTPLHDLMDGAGGNAQLAGDERVKVEYNWQGYEYYPSNWHSITLPTALQSSGQAQVPNIK
ncbi:unnamed protein product [Sphagnum balticum]